MKELPGWQTMKGYINSVVCDESGGLNPEYTFDGVHLYAQYIHIWKEYLMSHGVEFTMENE